MHLYWAFMIRRKVVPQHSESLSTTSQSVEVTVLGWFPLQALPKYPLPDCSGKSHYSVSKCGGSSVRVPQHLCALNSPDISAVFAFLLMSIGGILRGVSKNRLWNSPKEDEGEAWGYQGTDLCPSELYAISDYPPECLRLLTVEWTLEKESLNLEFETWSSSLGSTPYWPCALT